METKKWIAPFALAGLFAAFAVVCLLLAFKKGKREKWVALKMKLGAMIIAISGIATGCTPETVITCYDPVPENLISFDKTDSADYRTIIADLPADTVVTGKIYSRTYNEYTFEILKADSQSVQKGNLLPTDGAFNDSDESFRINLNTQIDTGKYHFNIFAITDNKKESFLINQSWLKIK
ncbi:MAG TPA: hypothetical protein PKH79_07350 [Prolixibacteraceae bacterium]|nr:hypothetical protein [Prolixibacteraceae bacterium]HPS13035.1 hypothetical protein [Prolixibacteraceae bacterium]